MNKAMVFAAGLGTRLRPLTNDRPKAMVEVNGMPLLEIQLRRLKAFGFEEVVVNVHHFADLIIDFLKENENFGVEIHISDERNLLLETGGGLKKAQKWLDSGDAFLVCNVDVLTDLDLHGLMAHHNQSDALATLAVRDRQTSRYLIWDSDMCLMAWQNIKTGEVRGKPHKNDKKLAFSGIQVLNPAIFEFMPEEGPFSIIDTYVSLAGTGKVRGFRHDNTIWMDVGKPRELAAAESVMDQVLPPG